MFAQAHAIPAAEFNAAVQIDIDIEVDSENLEIQGAECTDSTGVSVFDYLRKAGMLKKLVGVCLSKAGTPQHLRDDAAQEMQIYWSQLQAKSNLDRDQVCNYAYLAGVQVARRVHNRLGYVAALPGSAYRSQQSRDAADAMANPVSLDKSVNMGGDGDADAYDVLDDEALVAQESDELPATTTRAHLIDRLAGLKLRTAQRQVAELICVRGMSVEQASEQMGVAREYALRLLNDLVRKLEAVPA